MRQPSPIRFTTKHVTASSRLVARALLAAAGIALASHALGQAVAGGPLPGPLPLFPADNWWNADVSAAPVDAGSATFIAWIGAAKNMHPDFGGDVSTGSTDIYGMPYIVVPGTLALEPVAFDYATESDPGAPGRPAGYPIPVEAKTQPHWIEGGYPGNCDTAPVASPCHGTDKHMLVVDSGNRFLFETWNTRCLPAGNPACTWRAGSGAVFPLDSDLRRPDTWTSADAAGLAILPGLVRYDEAAGAGPIRHAFRVTLRDSNGYVYPASHAAGTNPGAPPLGTRLRLKASKDISTFPAQAQRIFQAMKTYGLIVADNGSDLYVQGTYDTRWDNGALNPAFSAIRASDFEVVLRGWQPSAGAVATTLFPVTPCRALDTRAPQGPRGGPAIPGNASRTFALAGVCGVPSGATAVSANLVVVNPSAQGDLIAFPAGIGVPLASTISFGAGTTRANNALIAVSGDGAGSVVVRNNSPGALDVVIDVNGYFQP